MEEHGPRQRAREGYFHALVGRLPRASLGERVRNRDFAWGCHFGVFGCQGCGRAPQGVSRGRISTLKVRARAKKKLLEAWEVVIILHRRCCTRRLLHRLQKTKRLRSIFHISPAI